MNPALSNFLDGSRWIAALAVLLTHINNRAFLKIGALEAGERPALLYLWSFVCGFAHHAVVTFFVLSGFLVRGKLLRDLRHIDGPYLRRYATASVVRIYLVLIPVIGLTALLDHQGGQLPGAASMYWPGVMESLTSPVALVGTVLNLQTIFTPLYGSNAPMWSLACEFWYYVCAPLLLAPWTRISPRLAWPMGALGVVLVVAFSVALPDCGAGLVLWFIGAAAAVATWKAPTRAGLLVLVFLGCCSCSGWSCVPSTWTSSCCAR